MIFIGLDCNVQYSAHDFGFYLVCPSTSFSVPLRQVFWPFPPGIHLVNGCIDFLRLVYPTSFAMSIMSGHHFLKNIMFIAHLRNFVSSFSIEFLVCHTYFTLVGSSDLAAPASQLLSLHAVLSSVRLTFSSKDALVHVLMLSMYCILGRPFFFSPTSFRECKSLQDYTYCFCMHVQRKPFFV